MAGMRTLCLDQSGEETRCSLAEWSQDRRILSSHNVSILACQCSHPCCPGHGSAKSHYASTSGQQGLAMAAEQEAGRMPNSVRPYHGMSCKTAEIPMRPLQSSCPYLQLNEAYRQICGVFGPRSTPLVPRQGAHGETRRVVHEVPMLLLRCGMSNELMEYRNWMKGSRRRRMRLRQTCSRILAARTTS